MSGWSRGDGPTVMQEPAKSQRDTTDSPRADAGADRPSAPPVANRQNQEIAEISLLELANVLLKRWKLVVGVPFIASLLAAVISLIVPAKFTATTSFVPETESAGVNLPGGLAGLAAQFGVAIPGGGANSPRFYADVLGSRTLRDEVLLASFPDPGSAAPGDSAPLLELLEIKGDSERERLEKGRDKIEKAVSVGVNNETNVVSLSVETPYPVLSADVANHFIALLNRFNLVSRQSNAQERRRFAEERMQQVESELREAEENLKRFLERNRQFRGSPELTFEYERLQRQVTIKQEVFTSLRRAYEEARIQEVNDTPVITVIDRAVPPQEKSSPKRRLNVVVAFFLGGVIGVVGAFGREFVERARERELDEYEEFTSRWAALKADLRSLLRRPKRHSS